MNQITAAKKDKAELGYELKLSITWGRMQVGLDKLTSANCKANLQFGLDKHY